MAEKSQAKEASVLPDDSQLPQPLTQDILSENEKKEEDSTTGHQLETPHAELNLSRIVWKEGKPSPDQMTRGAAVIHGNTAYFTLYGECTVWAYQSSLEDKQWSMLPENPYKDFGLTIIDGLLTSVGGFSFAERCTASLFSLRTGEEERKEWSEILPPMKCVRQNPACVTTAEVLVVAGGFRHAGRNHCGDLDSVEVMDFHTKQWTTVSPLPRKQPNLSAILHGDTLYLAGGDFSGSASESVFACSLPHLLTSTNTLASKIQRVLSPSRSVWREVSSLPLKGSTLASFCGHLLAIGGWKSRGTPETDVCAYDPGSDSWSVVSQMKTGMKRCFVLNFPGDQLLLVGPYCLFTVEA